MLENHPIPKPTPRKKIEPTPETLKLQKEIRSLTESLKNVRKTTKEEVVKSKHQGLRPTFVVVDEVKNMSIEDKIIKANPDKVFKKSPRPVPNKHLTDTPFADHPGLLNLKNSMEKKDE